MEGIPGSTRSFFQEYTFEKLDAEKDGELIIERILSYGSRDEIRWLIGRYGLSCVQEWLKSSMARRLPRRRYHLWCMLLDVEENTQPRRTAWPY